MIASTSSELYALMTPFKTSSENVQISPYNGSVMYNPSAMFSQLIKDAARCNYYNSDIFYDLKAIYDRLEAFKTPEEDPHYSDPIWLGFRKMGVDGTSFVLSRIGEDTHRAAQEYFALYSVKIDPAEDGYATVTFNEYAV